MGKKKKQKRAAALRYTGVICTAAVLALSGCQSRPQAEQVQPQEGEVLHLGGITFEMETAEFCEEVKPGKPRGYYDYYEAHEGYRYFVVRGNIRNESGGEVALDSCMVVAADGKKDREGVLTAADELESSFQDKLGAGDEAEGYLIVLVGEGEEPDTLEIYYNSDWSAPDGEEKYDFISEVSLENVKQKDAG